MATLATFTVTGLLHDGFFAITGFALHWRATMAFFVDAVVMVIWRPWNELVSGLLKRPAASLVMRATFWMLLLSIFGWWKA